VLETTAPNTGARSSDCGSTFHSLIKAQRDLTEDCAKEGVAPASLAATDLIISVTFKAPKNSSVTQPVRLRTVQTG
jgi:hypothetical protein